MQAEVNAKMTPIYELDTAKHAIPLSDSTIGVKPRMESLSPVIMDYPLRSLSFSFGLRIIEILDCSTSCESTRDHSSQGW